MKGLHARSSCALGGIAAMACVLLMALAAGPARAGIEVTPRGQASVSLPLSVPPGAAGLAPTLALSYVDGGINGPLGVGWSLQGVSAITRCPASRYLDGKAAGVAFTAADRLCLDGQRLIPLAAAAYAVGSAQPASQAGGVPGNLLYVEYRTEQDSFARIRAYGSSLGSNLDGGPAYFKVWTKAGLVYEYGPASSTDPVADSRIVPTVISTSPPVPKSTAVSLWPVSRISDVSGNYIDFFYGQRDVPWGSGQAATGDKGREWYLAEIQYTGQIRQTPLNKVVFQYEERSASAVFGHDRSEAIQLDRKNVGVLRLVAIRTYANFPGGSLTSADPTAIGSIPATALKVKTVKLSYGRSPVTGKSRLATITECLGAAEGTCLPPTSVTYTGTATPAFASHGAFAATSNPMSTLPMMDSVYGEYGVLLGDFNGDGRTDILRWSRTPSLNQLWLSQGDGSFTQAAAFNLTSVNLNGSDAATLNGCYKAMVGDFDGDGLSDILVAVTRTGCPYPGNRLYLSQGNGAFTNATTATLSGLDLTEVKSIASARAAPCQPPNVVPPTSGATPGVAVVTPARDLYGPADSAATQAAPPIPAAGQCFSYSKSTGRRVYVLDVDGDGYLDIVTTIDPGYSFNSGAYGVIPSGSNPLPTAQQLCQGTSAVSNGPLVCSRVWRGQAGGVFQEMTAPNNPTNIVNSSLYSDPVDPKDRRNPYWRLPNLADINGDGLVDILASGTGRWVSTGDGNFNSSTVTDSSQVCGTPIDFNGDGRSDCLWPGTSTATAAQWLSLSYGANTSGPLAQFSVDKPLYGVVSETDPQDLRQTVGVVIDDFDGDGRQDILRWGQTPASDNLIYYSNGDGSFRAGVGAGLQATGQPLQHIDGSTTFVVGDFLGSGAAQVLHIKNGPSASNTHKLYVRAGALPDLLQTLTSPGGLVSTVAGRVPISNAPGSYVGERGTPQAASLPMIDVAMPLYVVSSVQEDTGSGSALTTDYLYKGFKAFRDGSGTPGFRELRQRRPAPAGNAITTASELLLKRPYGGVAARVSTYLGGLDLSGPILSQVTNVYCDRTSATAPAAAGVDTPCASTVLVARPYLYSSDKQAWELPPPSNPRLALPRVVTTNTYNDWGDPTQIVVTTTGIVAGASRTHTRTVNNTYCNPNAPYISGGACPQALAEDKWVLGRLLSSSVTNSVPDLVAAGALTAGAGSAPLATAVQGNLTAGGTGVASVSPASLSFPSTNVGSTSAAQPVTVTNSGSTALAIQSVTATAEFAVSSNNCPATLAPGASCTISVTFTPAAAGSRSGSLTIANNGSTGNKTVALSGTGQAAGAGTASVSPASLSFPTTNVGSSSAAQSVTVTNGGSAALAIQSITATAEFTITGNNCPATLAVGASCTISVTFTPAAASARSGTLTIANNGSTGNKTVALSGTGQALQPNASVSPASLTYGSTNVGTTAAAQAVQVSNVGNAALSVSAPSITGDFAISSNNCSTVAAGGSCSIVVTFTPTAAGTRTGVLTIPNNGSSGTKTVALTGTGQVATASGTLTPNPLAFGQVEIGGGYSYRDLELQNTGPAPLSVGTATVTAPAIGVLPGVAFWLEATTCGATLAPGNLCTFTIGAVGVSNGSYTYGSFSLSGSNASLPQVQLSSLGFFNAGSGDLPQPTSAQQPSAALAVASATKGSSSSTLMLVNAGNAPATNLQAVCTEAGGMVSSLSSTILQPGTRIEVMVRHPPGGRCSPRFTASGTRNSPLTIRGY
ncbi:MAG: choice-of-anchor D domain-containing protein [Rubrivivax sp.]